MNIIRPHILSIHPTMQCDYNCVGCYLKKDQDKNLKEKDERFFIDLVKIAKKVGMKELAVPINYSNNINIREDKNYNYFYLLKEISEEVKMDFSITCNYDFFISYPDIDINNIKLISISLNDFVTGRKKDIEQCLRVMKRLRGKVPTINCNILLSDHMVKILNEGLIEKILENSDSIYLLTSKPLKVSLKKAGEWFDNLSKKFPIDSDRILIDTCIKYSFGLTSNKCDKHQMIYVNPYGQIKSCSFDCKNIAILKNPDEFEEIYNNLFPQDCEDKCFLMGMLK